jgi:putative cell wall-binding protein
VIVLGGRSAVAGDVLTALEAAVDVPVERVAGPERTATAAAASRAAFPDGAGTAFVATAAAAAGAPLLLVDGAVPPATAAELQRLEPERVVALGGAAAIPPAVADELAAVAGAPVERREGPDRYGTAAAAVAALSAATVDTVYVASGADYPDALVAGPAVAAEGGALLLVSPTAVPQPTAAALESLEPSRIVLLGGPAAIQGSVEDDLRAYVR